MYELIQHQRLEANATTITFNNIPQNFSDLVILTSVRTDRAGQVDDQLRMTFNGATSGYSERGLAGNGSSSFTFTGSASTSIQDIIWTTAANATTNAFGSSMLYIPNYTSTSAKSVISENITENNATAASQAIMVGLWNPGTQAPITSIVLTPLNGTNILQNSSATLYGIRRSATIGKPKAIGGSITYANGYWVHTFTGSGTFIPSQNLTVETLILAGGGGGGTPGASRCGGGGAGGVIQTSMPAISGGASYAVLVGAGGGIAATGSNSSFNNQIAFGGGFGASNVGQAGGSGGSGGGGNRVGMAGGAPVAGQGFVGGFGSTSSSASDSGGGGGGGAGGPGDHIANNAFTNEPASGGRGILSSISGTGTWYAEGGAGSGAYDRGIYNQNLGGNVSGAGHINGNAQTGSGGGGGKDGTAGGAGGSGIVIIRYLAD
jgi:hypothetical protein